MSVAIWVDNLSKEYKLGQALPTLRDRISGIMSLDFLRKQPDQATLWALKDVSLTIQQGETVGIIGRNGAGKSTLLKVLSKITYPTYGSTGIDGRVISLLEVGTGFHDELTGRENIYLNGSILGMAKKDVKRKFDAIVEFSGLAKFIDTPIKRFSSGMRLRLGFAVAAHLEPDILIVDEVLAVGDAEFQKKCLDTIQKLRAGARTILFVSHNLAAVENLCERCIWIDQGRVKLDGQTQTVIRDYMGSLRTSTATKVDLDDRQSRRGNGKIRFQGMEFLSPDGISQKVVRAGDPVVMRLHYSAHEPVTFPSFGFRMYTETGVLVTETSTSHHGLYIPSVSPGTGYLDLEIGALNLLAAKYAVSLWVTDQGGNVVYDNVENALNLEVDPANPYGSNIVVDGRFGIVFFPQRWNLSGMSNHVSNTGDSVMNPSELLTRE